MKGWTKKLIYMWVLVKYKELYAHRDKQSDRGAFKVPFLCFEGLGYHLNIISLDLPHISLEALGWGSDFCDKTWRFLTWAGVSVLHLFLLTLSLTYMVLKILSWLKVPRSLLKSDDTLLEFRKTKIFESVKNPLRTLLSHIMLK